MTVGATIWIIYLPFYIVTLLGNCWRQCCCCLCDPLVSLIEQYNKSLKKEPYSVLPTTFTPIFYRYVSQRFVIFSNDAYVNAENSAVLTWCGTQCAHSKVRINLEEFHLSPVINFILRPILKQHI